MRKGIDRTQSFFSLGQLVRHDQAERVLAANGFATNRSKPSFTPAFVGSPFVETIRSIDDDERLALAEQASLELLGTDVPLPFDDVPEAVLYVDLSATRYGRVPVGGRAWNSPERLTRAYRRLAEVVLRAISARGAQTFVFVPAGVYDRALLPPVDWQPVVLEPLPRTVFEAIVTRHGLSPSRRTPREIRASIATAQLAPPPG
jgi:hypothetical protein